MNAYSLTFSFIEGILTFISPCILPLLPVYLFYMAGVASGDSLGSGDRGRLLLHAVGFVLGFTVVFVLLGAAATSLGHFLRSHGDLIRKLSGLAMVLFGLNFAGVLNLRFLNTERRLEFSPERLDFFKAVLFGGVFGFGWTPCLGAFLGSALLLAGNSETLTQGILLLAVYSAGLGIPFILTALLFDRLKEPLRSMQKHGRLVSMISGIILIAAGILVFTDRLKYVGTWF